MGNTVQLLKDGQPVFPVTDVSLVMGLQDAIKLPPVKVATLPTASAETAGKMYYVGPDGNDEYERYITSAVGGSYSWIDLGDTSIPLPSIADNLTTADANTALSANQGVVLAGQIGQLDQLRTKFVGQGNTYSASAFIYNLIPGHTYRVTLPKTTWDKTGISSAGVALFSINSYYNSASTSLVYVDTANTPADHYDITIPTNHDYLRIGGRAVAGTSIYFDIADLSVPKIFRSVFATNLRNGSANNPSNTSAVCTACMPLNGRKLAGVVTNRPNLPGYHYEYGFGLTNSVSDLGSTGAANGMTGYIGGADVGGATAEQGLFDLSAYTGAVGVMFYILERSDADGTTNNPLRITDFANYQVEVVVADKAAATVQNSETTRVLTVNDFTKGSIYEGTDIPSQNAMFTPDYIPTQSKATIGLTYGTRTDGYHWTLRLVQYNAAKTRISNSTDETFTASTSIKLKDATRFVRMCFRLTNSSNTGVTFTSVASALAGGGITIALSGEDYASEEVLANTITNIEQKMTSPTGEYLGERIKLSNPYKISQVLPALTIEACQSFAIYGDYMVVVSPGESTITANIYNIRDRNLEGTVTLPYGSLHLPHCNVSCFSRTFATGNTKLPLLYVSQWAYSYERGCLVYNIKESGGTWSAELIQTIVPSGVSNSILGAGDVDWVVDYDNARLYALGYYLEGASTIVEGNKEMVVEFGLPDPFGSSAVTLADADVLDHYEVEIFNYSQDKCYKNGKIYIISGGGSEYTSMNKLRVLDLTQKAIVSKINVGSGFALEPEGLDVYEDKLFYNTSTTVYQFEF